MDINSTSGTVTATNPVTSNQNAVNILNLQIDGSGNLSLFGALQTAPNANSALVLQWLFSKMPNLIQFTNSSTGRALTQGGITTGSYVYAENPETTDNKQVFALVYQSGSSFMLLDNESHSITASSQSSGAYLELEEGSVAVAYNTFQFKPASDTGFYIINTASGLAVTDNGNNTGGTGKGVLYMDTFSSGSASQIWTPKSFLAYPN